MRLTRSRSSQPCFKFCVIGIEAYWLPDMAKDEDKSNQPNKGDHGV